MSEEKPTKKIIIKNPPKPQSRPPYQPKGQYQSSQRYGGGSKPFFKGKPAPVVLSKEEQAKMNDLETELKKLSQRMNDAEQNTVNKEKEFAQEAISHQLHLLLSNGKEVEGKLIEIEKYRIAMEIEGKPHYFYKHAVEGYHVTD